MRTPYQRWRTVIYKNESTTADCIEESLRKIQESKTGINTQFQPIFTEKKKGVMPQYNIRTDRFEIAREAKDKLNHYDALREKSKTEVGAKTENSEENSSENLEISK